MIVVLLVFDSDEDEDPEAEAVSLVVDEVVSVTVGDAVLEVGGGALLPPLVVVGVVSVAVESVVAVFELPVPRF